MSNTPQNTSFNQAYSEIPGKDQINVRDEIMEACCWETVNYFYMKKNGTRTLREKVQTNNGYINEVEEVERIFKKYGFNAFTGEPIKQEV